MEVISKSEWLRRFAVAASEAGVPDVLARLQAEEALHHGDAERYITPEAAATDATCRAVDHEGRSIELGRSLVVISEELDSIDTAGIAQLLGITREHATNRITKMPGFPAPCVNLSQKLRAWPRNEVIEFIKKRPRRRR